MHYDEIKSFWGDRLTRFAEAVLRPYPLPSDAKWFLVNVGLPDVPDEVERFGLKFVSSPDQLRLKSHAGQGYLVIGSSYEVYNIGVRLRTGAVIAFSETDRPAAWFINGNLAMFIWFLTMYDQHLEDYSRDPKRFDPETPEGQARIARLEEQFRACDLAAFNGENNLWSVTFEEMYYGLC